MWLCLSLLGLSECTVGSHWAVTIYGESPSFLHALSLSLPLAMLSGWGAGACSGCGMAEVILDLGTEGLSGSGRAF